MSIYFVGFLFHSYSNPHKLFSALLQLVWITINAAGNVLCETCFETSSDG